MLADNTYIIYTKLEYIQEFVKSAYLLIKIIKIFFLLWIYFEYILNHAFITLYMSKVFSRNETSFEDSQNLILSGIRICVVNYTKIRDVC